MNLKLLLCCVAMLCAFTASATIINVDNNPNRPTGYYENLQLAINAATDGDTLYVYPSNTAYGNITVDKELHLFGKGYTTSGANSYIQTLTLDTSASNNTNSTGSSFQGMKINKVNCYKPNIANIVFSGNYLSSYMTMGTNCPGWLFINNYITSYITINNNISVLITNNIFTNGQAIRTSSASSVVISHNLFFNHTYFSAVTNALIKDNMFMCNGATNETYMYHNTFYNNLSWRSALNPYTLPPTSNTGSNNISNQEPLFVTATSNYYFDATKDYHLTSTSPGKNAASDGTDVGPYGGNTPFVWGGSFSIPKIEETNITNPVINQTTPINVNVKAKSADL